MCATIHKMADALLQVVTDLVQGEFMQLGSKETENERFAHYLTKTYRKTASLIANSIKAVSSVSVSTGLGWQDVTWEQRL
jgi:decaprenyl-diphosphate synthase subunit 1